MGFTVVPLAQKARTKTLIADSDLNLGNYDLIATDVRGDTAEFYEFVGGVGNFSNVLGSGNLNIEGTGNIKGLTTFQNAVQVNGSLHVEGSINNVNIADNGEITTAQGVNGADFNGASITSTTFNGATISANKFNGAIIDTSGNVTGAKGTFSGAVTGASFNGNLSGKLTISSYTTSATGGIRAYTANAPSSLSGTMSASDQTFTLNTGTVTYHNTQLFNCTNIDRNITCTIKLQRTSSSGDTYTITVTDISTSAVQTKTLTVGGNSSGSTSVTINNAHKHSIRIDGTYSGGVYTITGTATGYYVA